MSSRESVSDSEVCNLRSLKHPYHPISTYNKKEQHARSHLREEVQVVSWFIFSNFFRNIFPDCWVFSADRLSRKQEKSKQASEQASMGDTLEKRVHMTSSNVTTKAPRPSQPDHWQGFSVALLLPDPHPTPRNLHVHFALPRTHFQRNRAVASPATSFQCHEITLPQRYRLCVLFGPELQPRPLPNKSDIAKWTQINHKPWSV